MSSLGDPANLDSGPVSEIEPQLQRWPGVLGTISIVFASLGLICYGCGSFNAILSPWLVSLAPPDQRPPATPTILLVIQITQACVAFLLSLWLLFAGIGLAKRRRWARGQHVGWSIAKLVVAVISTLVSLMLLDKSVQNINDQFAKSKFQFQITKEMMLLFMAVALVWFMFYPLFLILWFSRKKIKEEIEGWR